MAKQKDFDSFISNIEPSKTTVSYISSVQNNLREYLENHSEYKDIHKDTFLSGSYAKHTSIRPKKDDNKRDVDIIVVTNHSQQDNSIDVLKELQSVLQEKDVYKTSNNFNLTNIAKKEYINQDNTPNTLRNELKRQENDWKNSALLIICTQSIESIFNAMKDLQEEGMPLNVKEISLVNKALLNTSSLSAS